MVQIRQQNCIRTYPTQGEENESTCRNKAKKLFDYYRKHRDGIRNKPDRYVSFVGIEGDRNSRELMAMLRRHIDDPHKNNRFWELFKDKLDRVGKPDENSGRSLDELFLIHAYINNIRELFELYDDLPALVLLDQIETESC